jgi:hypothetical protein
MCRIPRIGAECGHHVVDGDRAARGAGAIVGDPNRVGDAVLEQQYPGRPLGIDDDGRDVDTFTAKGSHDQLAELAGADTTNPACVMSETRESDRDVGLAAGD